MPKYFKRSIGYSLINTLGWHTRRKLVIIESDDWGSIRMPSKEVYSFLLKKGYRVDESPHDRYDSLVCKEDLQALFEVLMSVKDKNNRPAVLTANSITANPDFEKIKNTDFQEYHYELFYDTLKKYNRLGVFDLWKEGLNKRIFIPQFHGREHINVPLFMRLLQKGDKDTHLAFGVGIAGIFPKENPQNRTYLVAYSIYSPEDLISHKSTITEGLELFEQVWGFQSQSFIAPCYTWSQSLEPVLSERHVQLIQGKMTQIEPKAEYKNRKIFHYSGEQNWLEQRYNIRNCVFEPTYSPHFDWVDSCLNQIQIAFNTHKPAVITSHRVNYIGAIEASNRDNNLLKLKTLLSVITRKWPDVEFISSDNLIENVNQNSYP